MVDQQASADGGSRLVATLSSRGVLGRVYGPLSRQIALIAWAELFSSGDFDRDFSLSRTDQAAPAVRYRTFYGPCNLAIEWPGNFWLDML